jgi:hypothetical protein
LFKALYMAAPLLDSEFLQYWTKLSIVQKESLLQVAKNYVHDPETGASVSDVRKKMILEDRVNYFNGTASGSYSWEQVKDMAANKEKRNGL